MSQLHKDDNAFTGLEAAIVFIAFVVVVAVFSYEILGAGFFTTQKSQKVVYAGISQASSTIQIVGNVYGVGAATRGTEVYKFNFTTSLAPGGSEIDFAKLSITYANLTRLENLVRNGSHVNGTVPGGPVQGQWAITEIMNDIGTRNSILEPGEQFVISAFPLQPAISYDQIDLEVKPSVGASLAIRRTIPASVSPIEVLF